MLREERRRSFCEFQLLLRLRELALEPLDLGSRRFERLWLEAELLLAAPTRRFVLPALVIQ